MRIPFVIFAVLLFAFAVDNSFGLCAENKDWPDAPCMDMIENGHYPQHQVDRWSEYYDYKGKQFMESKKQEMNQSIQDDTLQQWVDESNQNYNVWTYYHFSGEAPGSYPYHDAAFELITRDKMPLQNLVSVHNPFWYDPESWFFAGILGSMVAIPIIVLWRKKRK